MSFGASADINSNNTNSYVQLRTPAVREARDNAHTNANNTIGGCGGSVLFINAKPYDEGQMNVWSIKNGSQSKALETLSKNKFERPHVNDINIQNKVIQLFKINPTKSSLEIDQKLLAKYLIFYTLYGKEIDEVTGNLQLKQEIDNLHLKDKLDGLRMHNSSSAHENCTKKMIDFTASIYIYYLSTQENGMSLIRDAFFHYKEGFSGQFKNFLHNEIGISHYDIQQIPTPYLKNIKYVGGAFIKFNCFKFDIAMLLGEKFVKPSVFTPVKNSLLREIFTKEEIKEKKLEARKYFLNLISLKIHPLKETENSNPEEKKAMNERRQKLILNMMYFIKIVNAIPRNKINVDQSYGQLVDLIPENIIKELGLDSIEKKLNFVENMIWLDFHRNPQLWFKRAFVKAPTIIGIFLAYAALVIGHLGNAATSREETFIKNDWFKAGSMTGNVEEAAVHTIVVVPKMKHAIKEGTGFFLDAGDSLETIPYSAKCVLAKLASLYDSEDDMIYTPDNFWNSTPWQKTPMTKELIELMNDPKSDPHKLNGFHKIFFQEGYSSGFNFRKCNLRTRVEYSNYGDAIQEELKMLKKEQEENKKMIKNLVEQFNLLNPLNNTTHEETLLN